MKRRSRKFQPETAMLSILETRQMLSVATVTPSPSEIAPTSVSYDPVVPTMSLSPTAAAATMPNGPDAFEPDPISGPEPITTDPTVIAFVGPAPADPSLTSADPGPVSPPIAAPKAGDVALVRVILFQETNGQLTNTLHWEHTFAIASEVAVEGNASIDGKVFSGGIKGSRKITVTNEFKNSGDLLPGQSIYVIVTYRFTYSEKTVAFGKITWDKHWDGRIAGLVVTNNPPADSKGNPIPVDENGSGDPLPSPQS